MYELQRLLQRQVRQLASGVLGHPESSALDRTAEAGVSVRLRCHKRTSTKENAHPARQRGVNGRRGASLEEIGALYRSRFDIFARVAASVTGELGTSARRGAGSLRDRGAQARLVPG